MLLSVTVNHMKRFDLYSFVLVCVTANNYDLISFNIHYPLHMYYYAFRDKFEVNTQSVPYLAGLCFGLFITHVYIAHT